MLVASLSALTSLSLAQGALEHKEATTSINNNAVKEVAKNLIVKQEENLTEINKLELAATTFSRDEVTSRLLASQAYYNASLSFIQNNPPFNLNNEWLVKEELAKERSNSSFRNKTASKDIIV